MRLTRYVFIALVLTMTLSATAAERDRSRPPLIKRFIKFISQPLGDLVSPPHP